jgi:hypothetical protein
MIAFLIGIQAFRRKTFVLFRQKVLLFLDERNELEAGVELSARSLPNSCKGYEVIGTHTWPVVGVLWESLIGSKSAKGCSLHVDLD